MSGGRVELGLGAGWYEEEHRAYGIPFPPVGERFGRLEEYAEVVTGIWSTPEGQRFSFSGQHFQVQDSPGLPKPVQRPVPLIIGGSGPRRTPRLAARFAAEFNWWTRSPSASMRGRKRAPSGSISKCWTWRTWTTSRWWPVR
jgi:alkanesulfonate monooxygenase SsuD/methylene tetrahydromethanopterin reductase-like flavin-dependent oxidoreductase (luciferase family)